MRFETLAIRGAYDHTEALRNRGSICEPAYLSPAQHFGTSAEMRQTLSGEAPGWTYTRIDNPTTDSLESVIAMLEGYGSDVPVTTAVFPSGMAALVI